MTALRLAAQTHKALSPGVLRLSIKLPSIEVLKLEKNRTLYMKHFPLGIIGLVAITFFGCQTIDNPVSVGSSTAWNVHHFQTGATIGENKFETTTQFSSARTIRTGFDTLTRTNFNTLQPTRNDRQNFTFALALRGGVSSWLDIGFEIYLAFENSLARDLTVDGRGIKLFTKIQFLNLGKFKASFMPIFGYASGTQENDGFTLVRGLFAASGSARSLGAFYEVVLPVGYELSPYFTLTASAQMAWARHYVGVNYANSIAPPIQASWDITRQLQVPATSFGVQITEPTLGIRIHPQATFLFLENTIAPFFGIGIKF
jgi:hypothetical protein